MVVVVVPTLGVRIYMRISKCKRANGGGGGASPLSPHIYTYIRMYICMHRFIRKYVVVNGGGGGSNPPSPDLYISIYTYTYTHRHTYIHICD